MISSFGAKKRFTSLVPSSTESDPCIRFRPISIARSPLIVPGSESTGLVEPIELRTNEIALLPSTAMQTNGPEVIKETSPL